MAPRSKEPFDDHRERLFRRAPEALIDGDRALPDAVEVPACSMDREHFRRPEDVIDLVRWPACTKVLAMRANDLPGPVHTGEGSQRTQYNWALEDLPEDDNVAHCEVRLIKAGEQYSKKKPKSSQAKEEAKKQLAARLRVI